LKFPLTFLADHVMAPRSGAVSLALPFKAGLSQPKHAFRRVSDDGIEARGSNVADATWIQAPFAPGLERPG
jgi:hypothetical protein